MNARIVIIGLHHHARIVIIDSQNVAIFNGIPEHAAKEKRQSFAQVKRWKNRRQPMRRFSTQNITLPKHRCCVVI